MPFAAHLCNSLNNQRMLNDGKQSVLSLLHNRYRETFALMKISAQSWSLPRPGVGLWKHSKSALQHALLVYSAFSLCQAIKLLDQSGAGPQSKLPPT